MIMHFEFVGRDQVDELFETIKRGIKPFVDDLCGWDDEEQLIRIHKTAPITSYQWIHWKGKRAGLLCVRRKKESLHVHYLVIEERYQSIGLGKKVMGLVENMAAEMAVPKVTLSTFDKNVKAIEFYRKLGYRMAMQEQNFIAMEKRIRAYTY